MPGMRRSRWTSASGHQVGHERALHALDLAVEQLRLLEVGFGLQLPQHVELGHVLHVVLLQQPRDRVLSRHASLDEPEPGPEHVAERSEVVSDHVGPPGADQSAEDGPASWRRRGRS